MITGIVDADLLVYRCGFAAQKKRQIQREDGSIDHVRDVEPLSHALQNVDTTIAHFPDFNKLEFYLTGKGNWRYEAATIQPYKGNRDALAKPYWYKEIREHLINKYGAVVVDGMEADDMLGIRQTEEPEHTTCIVSFDKDLMMIPGYHYNFLKGTKHDVGERDGYRSFYRQCITGDRTDHIPGVEGCGPKTASRIIDEFSKERAMYDAARNYWHLSYPDGYTSESGKRRATDEVFMEVASLLWIARKDRERWGAPE